MQSESGVDVNNTKDKKNGTSRSSLQDSLDPGSKAYSTPEGDLPPAVAVAETFTNGCGAVCERERDLSMIPQLFRLSRR